MGVLAPMSTHMGHSAQPPIGTSKIFPAHVSGKRKNKPSMGWEAAMDIGSISYIGSIGFIGSILFTVLYFDLTLLLLCS